MTGKGSRLTSQLWQRIAALFQGRTAGAPFIDPRAHAWAKEVKLHSELPVQFRPFFKTQEALPYAVLMPTFRGGYGHPEVERLLCIRDGKVHVLEPARGRLNCTAYAPEHTDLIEYGVLLLHSWITLHGQDESGAIRSVTVRFNSVSDYLMAPFVNCLRGPEQEGSALMLETERAKLDYLAALHYKFRTYGRACIRSGGTLCHTIFQPEIRHERMRVLGISLARLASPAHLCILSNSELIDIREDSGQRWAKGSPHGAIWTYIPRSKITGATRAASADGTQEFSVHLQGDLRIRWLFDSNKTRQLEETIVALGS